MFVRTEQWPTSLLGTRLWYVSTSKICTYAWLWCHLRYFKHVPLSQHVCLRLLSLLDDVIPDWDLKERRGREALTKEALANPSKKWDCCSSVVVSWASFGFGRGDSRARNWQSHPLTMPLPPFFPPSEVTMTDPPNSHVFCSECERGREAKRNIEHEG